MALHLNQLIEQQQRQRGMGTLSTPLQARQTIDDTDDPLFDEDDIARFRRHSAESSHYEHYDDDDEEDEEDEFDEAERPDEFQRTVDRPAPAYAALHHRPASITSMRQSLLKSHTASRLPGISMTTRLLGHEGCVNTLAITPCGSLLFSGSDDTRVGIWDTHTVVPTTWNNSDSTPEAEEEEDGDSVGDDAGTRARRSVGSRVEEKWTTAATYPKPYRPKPKHMLATPHEANIFHVVPLLPGNDATAGNGLHSTVLPRQIVTCAGDGVVAMLDLERPDHIGDTLLSCNLMTLHAAALPEHPNTVLVATGGRSLILMDIRSRDRHTTVPIPGSRNDAAGPTTCIAFNPYLPTQFAAAHNCGVTLYDIRAMSTRSRATAAVDVSEGDGGFASRASAGRAMSDTYTTSPVCRIVPNRIHAIKTGDISVRSLAEPIEIGPSSVQFSSITKGRMLIGYRNEGVYIVDTEGQGERHTVETDGIDSLVIKPHRRFVGRRDERTFAKQATFLFDDTFVATGCDSGRLFIWDVRTSATIRKAPSDNMTVNCVLEHRNGPGIFVSGIDHNIKYWSLSSFALQRQPRCEPLPNCWDQTFIDRAFYHLDEWSPDAELRSVEAGAQSTQAQQADKSQSRSTSSRVPAVSSEALQPSAAAPSSVSSPSPAADRRQPSSTATSTWFDPSEPCDEPVKGDNDTYSFDALALYKLFRQDGSDGSDDASEELDMDESGGFLSLLMSSLKVVVTTAEAERKLDRAYRLLMKAREHVGKDDLHRFARCLHRFCKVMRFFPTCKDQGHRKLQLRIIYLTLAARAMVVSVGDPFATIACMNQAIIMNQRLTNDQGGIGEFKDALCAGQGPRAKPPTE